MTQSLTIPIQLIRNGILPTYGTPGSAGADLYAAIDEPMMIAPGTHAIIPCGFMIAVPQGFEAQIRSRSGLAVKNGIMVLNSPGTIDSDYRGEVKVILANMGTQPFEVTGGMRIAQMVIAPFISAIWTVTDVSKDHTDRSTGGFGSTGV